MPLFPDSFIRLLCLVIHSSVHLFRDSEDRRDMLGKRYVFQSLDLEQETFNVKFWSWKYSLDWHDGIISWVRGDGALETKFWLKITLLPRETFLVSINNIVISSFPRVLLPMTSKGRQVANGNGAGFPWKQYKLDLVTKLFVAHYWTDNRSRNSSRSTTNSNYLNLCVRSSPYFCALSISYSYTRPTLLLSSRIQGPRLTPPFSPSKPPFVFLFLVALSR